LIFIPRGTPHTWQNVGDTPARFFATFTPAAPQFEQFFVRYAELAPDERSVAAFARVADETQAMEVVGPPLAERHTS
jgi:oxalate decarboxylase/phosphoglucose isomerase-like protein (cupin superfamily)